MIMKDQATNLRILTGRQRSSFPGTFNGDRQTLLVVSGKGGVGKSFFSLHLAQALAGLGERVLLVDSNLQNPNLHVLTNTDPQYPLVYWLSENRPIQKEAVVRLWNNLDLLANTPQDNPQYGRFLENSQLFMELLSPLCESYDSVVIDTQTALGEWNVSLLKEADLGVLLSISDPTSVIDTYTYIKASLPYLQQPNLKLVVNQVIGEKTGLEAHQNLNLALKNFLDFEIELLGIVPFDMEVKRAGLEQKPVWEFSRRSGALREIQKMASALHAKKQEKKITDEPIYQEATL